MGGKGTVVRKVRSNTLKRENWADDFWQLAESKKTLKAGSTHTLTLILTQQRFGTVFERKERQANAGKLQVAATKPKTSSKIRNQRQSA